MLNDDEIMYGEYSVLVTDENTTVKKDRKGQKGIDIFFDDVAINDGRRWKAVDEIIYDTE